MRHVGDQARGAVMGPVIHHDHAVAAQPGDHPRHGQEPPVVRILPHRHGPQRIVIQRRVRGRPAGTLVAGHRMRPDIPLPQTGGLDLVAHHALDAAHIGERGPLVQHPGQRRERLRHRLERIAQHQQIRLRGGQRLDGRQAADAAGLGAGIRTRRMVPCQHLAPGVMQPAGQRPSDQAQPDHADALRRHPIRFRPCPYHSSSLSNSSARSLAATSNVPSSTCTPPSGSIHASTGGFGRSRRG